MAIPSVTYTFSNGTAANATEVNTNFTDLINALTDGTKSLTLDSITAGGTATFNGDINLGNSTVDTLLWSASLGSSIPVSTNNSYDFGTSTKGLASVYLGSSAGAFTTRLKSAAAASSYTYTLPIDAGTDGYYVDCIGSGSTAFAPLNDPYLLQNYGITATVGSSALTVTLKGANGSSLSSTNRFKIGFRNATAATGTPTHLIVTSDLSVVVSSGSTLGHTSNVPAYIYVYVINNAGTAALAVSTNLYSEGTILPTITAEGGAGAADSRSAIYATSATTNVAFRLVARLRVTEATAGTWATAPSEISLVPFRHNNSIARASGTPANANTGNPIIFPTVDIDTSGAYNNSTGEFTCTCDGFVEAKIYTGNATGAVRIDLYINGVADKTFAETDGGTARAFGSVLAPVSKGDVITLRPNNSNMTTFESTTWASFYNFGL